MASTMRMKRPDRFEIGRRQPHRRSQAGEKNRTRPTTKEIQPGQRLSVSAQIVGPEEVLPTGSGMNWPPGDQTDRAGFEM